MENFEPKNEKTESFLQGFVPDGDIYQLKLPQRSRMPIFDVHEISNSNESWLEYEGRTEAKELIYIRAENVHGGNARITEVRIDDEVVYTLNQTIH